MKSLRRRLPAAIEVFVDRMEVRNACHLQLGALGAHRKHCQGGKPKYPTTHVLLGWHKKRAGCQKVGCHGWFETVRSRMVRAKPSLARVLLTQAC